MKTLIKMQYQFCSHFTVSFISGEFRGKGVGATLQTRGKE